MCIAELCAARRTLPYASVSKRKLCNIVLHILAFGVLYTFPLYKSVFRGS